MKGLVLVLALASVAAAQDAKSLAAVDATWNELRMKPDVPALERLLVDDWLLTHSDGRVQGKREYLEELRTRTRANSSIANEDVAVRVYGSTGVVTGTSVQSGVSNGQPFGGKFRFTRVWVWDGTWRMASSHSSRIVEAKP
jgi:ketosteroid isomerase-like protein